RLALSSALSNLGIRVVATLARAWADCKPARKTHGLATVATRNLAVDNALAADFRSGASPQPCRTGTPAPRRPPARRDGPREPREIYRGRPRALLPGTRTPAGSAPRKKSRTGTDL